MRNRDEDKEKRVIEKAMELVVAEGFNGFSMNKLSKACGISVATLYIYYQDKDDLFKKIGRDIGKRFFETTLNGFTPTMSFRDGLRKQWENRTAFALKYPLDVAFFEIVRQSPYAEHIIQDRMGAFKENMSDFFHNCVNNKQLVPLPPEIFWAVAYGPLYTLLNFEREGRSMGGHSFKLSQEGIDAAFEMVIKALTPP